jgi:tRNA-dihydrouridine synthase
MLYGEILPHKPFAIMKKHFKAYVHGWDGAKELRMKLMEANSAAEFAEILEAAVPNLNISRGVPC